jgi:tRNA pseudouridine55 synthase
MKEREINIYKLELISWNPPFADIFVHCSSGTYIRSLARDIALAAGSRAHLCELTRTQVAGFSLDMADSTADFPRPVDKSVIACLGLPWFEIAQCDCQYISHGKPLEPVLEGKPFFLQGAPSKLKEGNFSAAVFAGETLAAIVEKKDGKWKYGCVL